MGAGRFLLVKLIGGGFRVGVAQLLVQRALAEVAGLDAKLIAQRMMGYTDGTSAPDAARYAALVSRDAGAPAQAGQPYPFFLAHAIDVPLAQFHERLGPPGDWLVEWKYDGIRAQLVKRGGQVWIWSRGEELVTERFPEIVAAAAGVADGSVLDGEVLVWQEGATAWPGAVRPAAAAHRPQDADQRRCWPRRRSASWPTTCSRWQGEDLRARPQRERRALLERALQGSPLPISPLLAADAWEALRALRESRTRARRRRLHAQARAVGLRRGRTKSDGTWWKWKIDPLGGRLRARLCAGRPRPPCQRLHRLQLRRLEPRAARRGRGRGRGRGDRAARGARRAAARAFAKAYSGLTDAEFRRVDALIRRTTIEKFGPVRSLKPTLVFELGFEGIDRSTRHKSGIAVRFPRMLRIRDDKPLHEADTLQTLETLLGAEASARLMPRGALWLRRRLRRSAHAAHPRRQSLWIPACAETCTESPADRGPV